MDFHFLSLIFCYSFSNCYAANKTVYAGVFLIQFIMILHDFVHLMSENYFRLVSDKLLLVYATA